MVVISGNHVIPGNLIYILFIGTNDLRLMYNNVVLQNNVQYLFIQDNG